MDNKRIRHRQANIEARFGYLFIAPNLLGMLIFIIIPIGASLYLSFTDWDLINPPRWVGFDNFTVKMVHDRQFWVSLRNTAVFSVLTIPLGILCSLLLALLLNRKVRGITFYRAAIFLPVILSMISISVIWRWIMNTDVGVVNYLLSWMHIQPIGWFTDTRYSLLSVSLIAIWKNVGFNMVILLAGLKGVPVHLYEAARIDGANRRDTLFRISLPLLTPSLFFVSLMSVIGSFQVFDLVYGLTKGGPGDSTRVLYYWIYQNAFNFFSMGYASALAWVVFLVLFTVTMLQMKYLGGKVNYEMD